MRFRAWIVLIGLLFSLPMGHCLAQPVADAPAANPLYVTWNPAKLSPDNPPVTVKVLVLNYDPISPAHGHKRLTELFHWHDAAELATKYKELMEHAAGGCVRFEIVEWRNLNEIYAKEDGSRYTIDEYVRNRKSNSGWRDGMADYPRIMYEQNVVPLINEGLVDEVWIFSDHFFGLWEASMAGPRSFFINGGVYPQVPSRRPFAFYGFNYERAVAEMAHNTSHRTEATMNRIYGGWNLKAPTTNWDKFAANHDQSGGLAGVGTCHWPPNATHDYDYENKREVLSWADDFLDYPHLDGARKPVSAAIWKNHEGYMHWFFARLPRAPGVNDDGRQNNWWKYLYDFDNYSDDGKAGPPRAELLPSDLYELGGASHLIKVAYRSPSPVRMTTLGDDDLRIVAPNGASIDAKFVAASDRRDGSYRVAAYRVLAPGGAWREEDRGIYTVRLAEGAVACASGQTFSGAVVGQFKIGSTAAMRPAADASTLVLLSCDESLKTHQGTEPAKAADVELVASPFGKGARFRDGSTLLYECKHALDPQRGTIEFFVKPEWDGTIGTTRILLTAGRGFDRGLLVQIDGANNLRLMMWGDDPATEEIENHRELGVGCPAADWKKGQWRHVAATWDADKPEMALYVDGRQVERINRAVRVEAFSRPTFNLGSSMDGKNACAAVLDEIRISNRARSAEEIAATYEASQELGQLKIEPASLMLDLSQRRALKVLSQTPAGGLRDVTSLARWKVEKSDVARIDRHGNLVAVAAGKTRVAAMIGGAVALMEVETRGEAPPTAQLARPLALPASGNAPMKFEVNFRGGPLDHSSIDNSDIRVVGPAGFHAFARRGAIKEQGASLSAVYELPAPAKGWQSLPAGRYTVELKAWQVHSPDGRFVQETLLGTAER